MYSILGFLDRSSIVAVLEVISRVLRSTAIERRALLSAVKPILRICGVEWLKSMSCIILYFGKFFLELVNIGYSVSMSVNLVASRGYRQHLD